MVYLQKNDNVSETTILADDVITNQVNHNEKEAIHVVLPQDIPHNEAILIPNHYTVRATSSNTHHTFKTMERETEKDENHLNTFMRPLPPFKSDLFSESKMAPRKDKLPMNPPGLPNTSDFFSKNRPNIDPDRESQIAWSDEESVHTEWSDGNVWSDDDDVVNTGSFEILALD